MSLDSLKLLEAQIAELITQHERVRHANEELAKQVKEQERQLAEAAARIRQFEKERDEVKGRVEKVLHRLEGLNLS